MKKTIVMGLMGLVVVLGICGVVRGASNCAIGEFEVNCTHSPDCANTVCSATDVATLCDSCDPNPTCIAGAECSDCDYQPPCDGNCETECSVCQQKVPSNHVDPYTDCNSDCDGCGELGNHNPDPANCLEHCTICGLYGPCTFVNNQCTKCHGLEQDQCSKCRSYSGCSCPSPSASYSEFSRWKENALSQGRKISLSGMPMPDVAQHQEGESDYKSENTYVDALSLNLCHDVTDIHVPVGSGHFALEVRRSLVQEIWNTNSLPFEAQVDKPFGPCWSSAICPSVHVIEDSGETKYLVTDHNGQTYTFHELETVDEGGASTSISRIEASSTQSALSLKDVKFGQLAGGEDWVLYLANGTKCRYGEDPESTTTVTTVGDGDLITHSFHRILNVLDRAGNTLTYAEPEHEESVIPSEIEASSGQKLEIAVSNNLVTAITDPRGHTINYEYSNEGHLFKVQRPDGGETTYTYADSVEQDTRSDECSALEDGNKLNTHHLTIESIEDANGNPYEFIFVNSLRYDDFTINEESYNIPQLMNPQVLQKVIRPDDSVVSFAEFNAEDPPYL